MHYRESGIAMILKSSLSVPGNLYVTKRYSLKRGYPAEAGQSPSWRDLRGRAVCIERCTYGSDGGGVDFTGFLPYSINAPSTPHKRRALGIGHNINSIRFNQIRGFSSTSLLHNKSGEPEVNSQNKTPEQSDLDNSQSESNTSDVFNGSLHRNEDDGYNP